MSFSAKIENTASQFSLVISGPLASASAQTPATKALAVICFSFLVKAAFWVAFLNFLKRCCAAFVTRGGCLMGFIT